VNCGFFLTTPSLIREGRGGFGGVDKPHRLSATSPCQGRKWLGWVCSVNKPLWPLAISP